MCSTPTCVRCPSESRASCAWGETGWREDISGDRCGPAVGAKLLYEDDSIQHAGLYFRQIQERSDSWYNMHYFKGLHRNFPGASDTREVPAVTAACLLVEKTLYDEVGGLDDGFIQGDFEDSDFCLSDRSSE